MTTVTGTSGTAAASTPAKSGFGALGSGDFLKLLTTQLSQQDPTDPVDNKDMLAQLAQFSTLSQQAESSASLTAIGDKLDTMIALQTQTNAMLAAATTPTT